MLADEILVRQRLKPRTLGLLAALLAVVQFFIAQEFLLTEAIVGRHPRGGARGHASRRGSQRTLRSSRARIAWAVPPTVRAARVPDLVAVLRRDHVVAARRHPWHGYLRHGSRQLRRADGCAVDRAARRRPTCPHISAATRPNGTRTSGYHSSWCWFSRRCASGAFRRSGLRAVLALALAVLSLGPHINVQGHALLALPLPWWIPAHLPLLDDILPNRLIVYVDLAAAIIVAFTLRMLWLMRRSPLLNVAVAAVVLLPLVPTLPAPTTPLTTPAAFASTAPARDCAGRHRALRAVSEQRLSRTRCCGRSAPFRVPIDRRLHHRAVRAGCRGAPGAHPLDRGDVRRRDPLGD